MPAPPSERKAAPPRFKTDNQRRPSERMDVNDFAHVVRASPWRPSTASGVSWLLTRTPGLPAPRARVLPPRTHVRCVPKAVRKSLGAATKAGLGDALTPESRPQGRSSVKGRCPGKGGPWPVSPGGQPFLWLLLTPS